MRATSQSPSYWKLPKRAIRWPVAQLVSIPECNALERHVSLFLNLVCNPGSLFSVWINTDYYNQITSDEAKSSYPSSVGILGIIWQEKLINSADELGSSLIITTPLSDGRDTNKRRMPTRHKCSPVIHRVMIKNVAVLGVSQNQKCRTLAGQPKASGTLGCTLISVLLKLASM